MEKISTPQARATIVWIVAEFCSRNDYARKVAPDVLRKIAKTFVNENDLVKLQALNLAAKLHITLIGDGQELDATSAINFDRLKLLIGYVFNLAKYDLNYDVRDRGRFLRQLLNDLTLAKQILLVPKLVPNVSQRTAPVYLGVYTSESSPASAAALVISSANQLAPSADSSRFRVGTLSHFLGKKATDYEELPDWPEVQPDPSVRKSKVPEKAAATIITGTARTEKTIGKSLSSKKKVPQKNGFLRFDSNSI